MQSFLDSTSVGSDGDSLLLESSLQKYERVLSRTLVQDIRCNIGKFFTVSFTCLIVIDLFSICTENADSNSRISSGVHLCLPAHFSNYCCSGDNLSFTGFFIFQLHRLTSVSSQAPF